MRNFIALLLAAGAMAGAGAARAAAANAPAAAPKGAARVPASLSVRRLAAIVDARYNSLHTMSARFTEIFTAPGEHRVESGRVWLRHPGLMRWDYETPQRKLFLIGRHNAWLYIYGTRTAQRTPLAASRDLRTPLRFLLGKTHLERELEGLSYGGLNPLRAGDWVLRGRPKDMDGIYREVLLEVSRAYNIRRLVMREVTGAEVDLRFSQIQANHRLPRGRFHFRLPAGVMIVAGPAQ